MFVKIGPRPVAMVMCCDKLRIKTRSPLPATKQPVITDCVCFLSAVITRNFRAHQLPCARPANDVPYIIVGVGGNLLSGSVSFEGGLFGGGGGGVTYAQVSSVHFKVRRSP